MWRSVLGRASAASKQILWTSRTGKLSSSQSLSYISVHKTPRILLVHHNYSTANSNFEENPHLSLSENENYDLRVEENRLVYENGDAHDFEVSANNDVVEEEGCNVGNEEASEVEMSTNDDFFEEGKYEVDIEKLQSVLSLLQSSVDGSLESSLEGLDLDLHEEFLVKVLETPLIPGENLIGFYKWAVRDERVLVSPRLVNSLVRGVCCQLRKKNAYLLWDLVKEIGEKGEGVVSAEILNELIALFSKLGKGKAAFEVFDKFEVFGCVPNEDTYFFTVEALCRRSFFDWAVTVSEKMVDAGLLPSGDKLGNVVSWFCKGRKANHAHLLYSLATEKDKNLPRSSVNFLISSLCQEDETVKLALEMLDDLSGDVCVKSVKIYSTVIRGLCRIKDVETAKRLLHRMIDAGPPPGNNVFNLVTNALSKAGDMEDAKEVVKLMEKRGLKPDVYTYSVIMSGYAKGGQLEDAYKVFSEAKKKHAKLTPVTYHILIRGYCKLEQFDKALELLSEMKDYGVQPNTDEYNKLIQSLCLKAQDWETAEKLLAETKENGLHLNGITRGLIQAVKDLEAETLGIEAVTAEA